MDLKTALELGRECGLTDVGEAIYNIRLRVGQLFEIDDYKNLIDDYHRKGANVDDTIEDWLKKL